MLLFARSSRLQDDSNAKSNLRQRRGRTLLMEHLEQKDVPATLSQIGAAYSETLGNFAKTDLVVPILRSVPDSIQKSMASEASDNIEGALDDSMKRARKTFAEVAKTGVVPKLDTGFKLDLNPAGKPSGFAARLSFNTSSKYSDRFTIYDDRSGVENFDKKFDGKLDGSGDVTGDLIVKWAIDLIEKNGVLSAKVVEDDSFAQLRITTGTASLNGRGSLGYLSDVTLAGQGSMSGNALFRLSGGSKNGISTQTDFDLGLSISTKTTSNETFSKNVTWTMTDATRLADANTLRRFQTKYTAPSAFSLLKASVDGLQKYQVSLPTEIGATVQKVLDTPVPFYPSKTIGEAVGYPTKVPLVIATIDTNRFSTFEALSAAVEKDKRFDVIMVGQGEADAFARGEKTSILSVKSKASIGTSFTLAAGPSGTIVIYPGVTLKGSSGIYVNLETRLDMMVQIDTSGLGIREGSKLDLEIEFDASLKGELKVLDVDLGFLSFSLASADISSGAYIEGIVSASLGKPFDSDGKPTGSGIWYVGAGSKFNPKRSVEDFLLVDQVINAGVYVKTKGKILFGVISWNETWSKSYLLARKTRRPLAALS